MSQELQLVAAAAIAALITLAAVPVARFLAVRTNTLDHPIGYKTHGRSTPYLGGAAVIGSVVLVAAAFSRAFPDYDTLFLVTLALCALGTLDDRVGLPIGPRLVAQGLAAIALYASGVHWEFGAGAGVDVAVTVLWVIGVVNAFNLMDNLDGATAVTGAVAALGVGLLAAVEEVWPLAELMLALSAACGVFLVFNLSRPSRIFLGDGGSMPIGFLIAGGVMALPQGELSGLGAPCRCAAGRSRDPGHHPRRDLPKASRPPRPEWRARSSDASPARPARLGSRRRAGTGCRASAARGPRHRALPGFGRGDRRGHPCLRRGWPWRALAA